MTSTKGNQPRLRQKLAEEAQLLAEEKWLIEALKKLKEHRNCLQIERLHLESLRAQILSGGENSYGSAAFNPTVLSDDPQPSTSKATVPYPAQPGTSQAMDLKTTLIDDVPVAGIDDEMCNTEELNLAVTNPVFSQEDQCNFDIEEEDEDMDNCEIDMNMFMYGK